MTPERSRKAGRRWTAAALILIVIVFPVKVLGLDTISVPLLALALVCFFAAGERHGWADGYMDALRDEEELLHADRRAH